MHDMCMLTGMYRVSLVRKLITNLQLYILSYSTNFYHNNVHVDVVKGLSTAEGTRGHATLTRQKLQIVTKNST